jgi:hypothetical protein
MFLLIFKSKESIIVVNLTLTIILLKNIKRTLALRNDEQ